MFLAAVYMVPTDSAAPLPTKSTCMAGGVFDAKLNPSTTFTKSGQPRTLSKSLSYYGEVLYPGSSVVAA